MTQGSTQRGATAASTDLAEAFGAVDTWIFDLDNTLYPAECNLFAQIDQRMGDFISDFLQVEWEEARRIQKQYFRDYGTTLNGLMNVHGMSPEPYLEFVHDIDHSVIPPSPELDTALRALPGRKVIYTNGSISHAERVLARIGITEHFNDMHDIKASDYAPKPHRGSYEELLKRTGIAPEQSAMFEDIARNLEVPHELGMVTVLVRTDTFHPDRGHVHLGTGEEPYVHHVTEDLASFLKKLSKALQVPTASS